MRIQRKQEHLNLARKYSTHNPFSLLEDISLVPYNLSGYSLEDIEIGVTFAGKHLSVPLVINAMTGGCEEATEINRRLSQLAARTGMGLAVGSQRSGLENPELHTSYTVVRQMNPEGLILANMSALSGLNEVEQAIAMINADGIQLHINQAQELAMLEGERDFSQLASNIRQLIPQLKVPVIIKEVGHGIAREDALLLWQSGVCTIDVGGRGGTNFVNLENQRSGLFGSSLEKWGLPTAISLIECLSVPDLKVIASGGVRSALDVARCLALGADMVGMALPFLHLTAYSDEDMLAAVERFIYQLKCVFLLCGARNIEELRQRPLVITGMTREWMHLRELQLRRAT